MRRTIIAVVLALLATTLLVATVVAKIVYVDQVSGVEVYAGKVIKNGEAVKGATFVGAAEGPLPGAITVSIDYYPPGQQGPGGINTITGGSWSLKGYERSLGWYSVSGKVLGGTATWGAFGYPNLAWAEIYLSVTRDSGLGLASGSFMGVLDHDNLVAGVAPTWYGELTLND